MDAVKIKDNWLFVNGKRHILLSGEFHYWRHNPAYWDAIFDRIHELGVEIVSSFIPFNFHEISKGQFDFEGRTMPERNLAGFLDHAARRGFLVILRPAPSEAGEWPNAGLPERLLGFHRLHPTYVRAVKTYYDAVLPIVVPRQATHGGSIVMVQADNEPHADFVGSYDHLVGPRGLFNRWLRMRYATLADLNRAWGSDYRSFTEAAPFLEEPLVDQSQPELHPLVPGGRFERRFADTQRFVMWYATEIVRWTADYFRKAGVTVPLSANIWHPSAMDLTALKSVVDYVGVDLYPGQYFGLDKAVGGTSRAHSSGLQTMLESIKLTQARVGYVFIPECSAGIPSGWVAEYGGHAGNHPMFALLTFLMYGAKAISFYMLVCRDNWHGSPIDNFGNPTSRFGMYRDFIRIMCHVDPPALNHITDISLFTGQDAFATDSGNWRHVIQALMGAELDFDFYDPEASAKPNTPCLIYGGTERLARKEQLRLRRFVEDGGTLICFSRFPTCDEVGNPCNELDLPLPSAVRPLATPLNLACGGSLVGLDKCGHCGRVQAFDYGHLALESDEQITALQLKTYIAVPGGDAVHRTADDSAMRRQPVTIGLVRKMGRGKLVVAGINPLPAVVNLLLKTLDIGWYVRSFDPGVATTLHRKRRDEWILFVRNDTPRAVSARVRLETKRLGISDTRNYRVDDLRTGTGDTMSGVHLHDLTVSVPGFDVGVYTIRVSKEGVLSKIV